jgi:hypothetical protein
MGDPEAKSREQAAVSSSFFRGQKTSRRMKVKLGLEGS